MYAIANALFRTLGVLQSPKNVILIILLCFSSSKYSNFASQRNMKLGENYSLDFLSGAREVPKFVVEKTPDEVQKAMEILDYEALAAVKMALKFKKMDKFEKAQKLFLHAMVLCPLNHDVLLHYGEFLESIKDFINADHFYLKASLLVPGNSPALANHERIESMVNELDLKEFKTIVKKCARFNSLNNNDPMLKKLKKELEIEFIHNSVAIEGNTLSLAETQTVIETMSGKSILEYEILGVKSALQYVNQILSPKNNITVLDILEIHRRVMEHIDPTTAGRFRKFQVFVGGHTPPAASDVERLMNEFVDVLQSPQILNLHPVKIAAFAHYKLVFIHPFTDGNGRTARLLMNLLFIRYGYPHVIIRKENRTQYFKSLQIAHEGDKRPFYRFIAHATECSLDDFLNVNECNSKPKALESKYDVMDTIAL